MSAETSEWLNQNTLIGFTEKRGQAWHYRASDQGTKPNHYGGAIPIEDVRRRLFDWRAESHELFVQAEEHGLVQVPNRQAITTSDSGDVLGIFADGYQIHQYQDWLLNNVAALLDGGLSIGSAGLLKYRAQAWVSVEVPDNIQTPEGVEFRPHLLACTSHDGSLATTYKRTITNVVCDNTMGAALREKGQAVKVRHSKYSTMRVLDARNALDLVQVLADDFAAEVTRLCRIDVSDKQWRKFLDVIVPKRGDSARARAIMDTKRSALRKLWETDERVSPWKNTAWGALQAVNTFEHHHAVVRGMSRAERNFSRALSGRTEALDESTLESLSTLLAA